MSHKKAKCWWILNSCLKQHSLSLSKVFISISCLKQHFMLNTPFTCNFMPNSDLSCIYTSKWWAKPEIAYLLVVKTWKPYIWLAFSDEAPYVTESRPLGLIPLEGEGKAKYTYVCIYLWLKPFKGGYSNNMRGGK